MLTVKEFVDFYKDLNFPLVSKAMSIIKSDLSDVEKVFNLKYMVLGSNICHENFPMQYEATNPEQAKAGNELFQEFELLYNLNDTIHAWYDNSVLPNFNEFYEDVSQTFSSYDLQSLEFTPAFDALVAHNCSNEII